VLFDWMAQGQFRIHAILVAARIIFLPPAVDVARFLQFVQNALHRPVRDTDLLGNVELRKPTGASQGAMTNWGWDLSLPRRTVMILDRGGCA